MKVDLHLRQNQKVGQELFFKDFDDDKFISNSLISSFV